MEWLGQIEGILSLITYFVVMTVFVLIGIYVFFTEEGKRFRQAKKNNEPIRKGEYNSKLRKVIIILAGVVSPILIVLGFISHSL